MRVVAGQISHETNSFSPVSTGLEEFRARGYATGEEVTERFLGTRTPLGGFFSAGEEAKMEILPTVAASAVPSGIVCADAYQHLLQQLRTGIAAAGDIDGVLLALHGAMVVDGIADAEGDILRQVREWVGDDVPVVCTLDYHANVTDEMVQRADGLFGYNTYPHVDGFERGVEACEFLAAVLDGSVCPVRSVTRPPLAPPVVPARTGWGPMRELMERAFSWEERDGVIDVGAYGGFVYSDVRDAGLAFVATVDGDRELAAHITRDLAGRAWELREDFVADLLPPQEAVWRAMQACGRPVILADVADNTGGGAAGDGTELLRAMLELGAEEAAVIMIPDQEAVQRAFSAGVNGSFSGEVGGRIDGLSGDPVQVDGRVRLLSDGQFTHRGPMSTGLRSDLGRTAVVVCGGVEVMLTERRLQPLDPAVARSVGIEPVYRKMVAVKSAVHYRAAYEPLAEEIIEVDGPGLSSPNLDRFDFQNIRRPVFPLDSM